MRVEDKGDYWEVDGGNWIMLKRVGIIYTNGIYDEIPPFLTGLIDSLINEVENEIS